MLKLTLLGFALLTVVAALGQQENKRCEPNSVFRQACNTCRCAKDGSGSVCTRKQCIPGDENEPARARRNTDDGVIELADDSQPCEQGKRYRVKCNTCSCSSNNQLACTRRRCPPTRRSTVQDVPSTCEPGTSFKWACNSCTCTPNGLPICTMMACVTTLEEADTPSEIV